VSSKYEKMGDYDVFPIPEEGDVVYLACCDCGLVHIIAWFEHIETGEVTLRCYRDNRRTAQLRRNKYGELHTKDGKWRLIREDKS
jgi:hypothetical protein